MLKINIQLYDNVKANYLWNVMVLTQRLQMRVKFINTVFMGLIRKRCYALLELPNRNVII